MTKRAPARTTVWWPCSRPRRHAVRRGSSSSASDPDAIRNGAIREKAWSEVMSRSPAPAAPPATATRLQRQSQLPRRRSSGWEASAEPGQQATRATLLAMLAGSAGNPTASRAGYDTDEVIPPAVPTTPAATPAAISAVVSSADSTPTGGGARRRGLAPPTSARARTAAGGTPRAPPRSHAGAAMPRTAGAPGGTPGGRRARAPRPRARRHARDPRPTRSRRPRLLDRVLLLQQLQVDPRVRDSRGVEPLLEGLAVGVAHADEQISLRAFDLLPHHRLANRAEVVQLRSEVGAQRFTLLLEVRAPALDPELPDLVGAVLVEGEGERLDGGLVREAAGRRQLIDADQLVAVLGLHERVELGLVLQVRLLQLAARADVQRLDGIDRAEVVLGEIGRDVHGEREVERDPLAHGVVARARAGLPGGVIARGRAEGEELVAGDRRAGQRLDDDVLEVGVELRPVCEAGDPDVLVDLIEPRLRALVRGAQGLRFHHLVERLVQEARRAEPADDVLDVAVLVVVELSQHRELVLGQPEPEHVARLGHDIADVVGGPVREVLELRGVLEDAADAVVDQPRDRALQPQRLALARLVVRLIDPLLAAVHPHLPLQQPPHRLVADPALQREQVRGAEAGRAEGGGHALADRCPAVGGGWCPLLRVRCRPLPVLPARPPRSQRG